MANTACTIAVNLTNKTVTVTGKMSIREKVLMTLTGTGSFGATDLVVALISGKGGNFDMVAQCSTLSTTADGLEGILNLNTTELVALFEHKNAQTEKALTLVVWDTTNSATLVNDAVTVMNNPYEEDMEDPTDTDPIGGSDDYAPIDNGVTNGDEHDHSGGDGATIDHDNLANKGSYTHAQVDSFIDDVPSLYAPLKPDGGQYRFSGGKLYLYCPDDSKWVQIMPRYRDGSYTLEPQTGESDP